MLRTTLLCLVSMMSLGIMGQTPNASPNLKTNEQPTLADSTRSHMLEEFVVEGLNRSITKDGLVITPTTKDKKYADNAYSLVRNLAVPFLQATDDNIVSLYGDISIFINYHSASKSDLNGLRPKDVLKVEYLEYPTDPRFMGANFVLNFVVKEYDLGGYLRLMANQKFGFNSGNYGFYNKTNKGKMSYDIAGNAYYSSNNNYLESNSLYSGLKSTDGTNWNVSDNINQKSHSAINSYATSFRARYSDRKIQITNTLNFSFNKQPSPSTEGEEIFESTPLNVDPIYTPNKSVYYSESDNSKHTATYSWRNTTFMRLSDKSAFVINPSFSYTHDNSSSSYILGEQNPIVTSIKQDAYVGLLQLVYSIRASQTCAFEVNTMQNINYYSSLYAGDIAGNPTTRYRNYQGGYFVNYHQGLSPKLSLTISGGSVYNYSNNNGSSRAKWSPYVVGELGLRLSNQFSINLNETYAFVAKPISYSTDMRIKVNEIEWIQGNPYMTDGNQIGTSLRVNWIQSKIFSAAAFISFKENHNVTSAYWYPEGEYMIKQYRTDGYSNLLTAMVSPSINLLDQSLRLSPRLGYNYGVFNGGMRSRVHYWDASFSAQYTFRNYSVGGYVNSPNRSTSVMQMGKFPMQYGLTFNYYTGNLRAGISCQNIFSTRGKITKWTYTDCYNMFSKEFTRDNGRTVAISLSYTFDYGKKLNDRSEINASVESNAQILN